MIIKSKKFQKDRNLEIYSKHLIEGKSYNELAREYGLTPQRIHLIVKDLRKRPS